MRNIVLFFRLLIVVIFSLIFFSDFVLAAPFTGTCTAGGTCSCQPSTFKCYGVNEYCFDISQCTSTCSISQPPNTVATQSCSVSFSGTCSCGDTYCSGTGTCSCENAYTECIYDCKSGWFDEDGAEANGCENAAPKWYTPSENLTTTIPGQVVEFSVNWTDTTGNSNQGLGVNYTWFSWNASGAGCDQWVNLSYTSQNNIQSIWFNLTQTIPSVCGGKTIAWKQYANDSAGRTNVSEERYLTPELLAPKYFDNSTNSTIAGALIEFRLRWTDNTALSMGVLSVDNCTGTFQNVTTSWKSFTGTEDWLNYSVVINSTVGCEIRWKQYANDTSNNWNVSEEFGFVTRQLFVYTIKGYTLDFMSGLPISSGNVTTIVKETGERSTNAFANGYWTVNLKSLQDYSQNRFTVGIYTSSADKKTGYRYIRLGHGSWVPQTQECSRKLWHFKGRAIDSETGQLINSGRITVSVRGTNEVNSTNFSNGIWEIDFSSCLISGELYTFQFNIIGDNKKGYMFLKQVAK
jgi:hypothetical protein